MKLALIRHAHRDHGNPHISRQGHTQASQVGQILLSQGFAPTRVLSTRSTRTKETAAAVLEPLGLDLEPGPNFKGALFKKRVQWDAYLSGLLNDPQDTLMVGHGYFEELLAWMGVLPPTWRGNLPKASGALVELTSAGILHSVLLHPTQEPERR